MNNLLKNGFLIMCLLMFVASLVWTFGKFSNLDMSQLERQTFSIMSGIKFLTAIALYVAWRVTPSSK